MMVELERWGEDKGGVDSRDGGRGGGQQMTAEMLAEIGKVGVIAVMVGLERWGRVGLKVELTAVTVGIGITGVGSTGEEECVGSAG